MKFLITDHDFPDVDLELGILRNAGHEVVSAQCRNESDVIKAARGCSGLLAQYAPINAEVFAALPELRIVSRFGAGFDTVNVDDAAAAGVWVANSPDYGVGEVSTHALAMALGLIRHLPFYDRDVRSGKWHYESTGKLRRISHMTLGILGLGRIGGRMAEIALPNFGKVIACDPYCDVEHWPTSIERVALEGLFQCSDVISLHTPLNDETRGLVDARLIQLMRDGSFVVNTARGAIINVDDLLAALNSGKLAGAALDVLPVEPPQNHPITRHPRVLLTPHSAFYSVESEIELRRKAVINLVDWAATGRPTYVVVEGRSRTG